MSKGINSIKINDVERALGAAVMDQQIDTPMHRTQAEDKLDINGIHADVKKTITGRKTKRFIAEEADSIFAKIN